MIQGRLHKDEVTAVSLRMPLDLRNEMKIQAIRAGRSLNTHVVMILQRALADSESQA